VKVAVSRLGGDANLLGVAWAAMGMGYQQPRNSEPWTTIREAPLFVDLHGHCGSLIVISTWRNTILTPMTNYWSPPAILRSTPSVPFLNTQVGRVDGYSPDL